MAFNIDYCIWVSRVRVGALETSRNERKDRVSYICSEEGDMGHYIPFVITIRVHNSSRRLSAASIDMHQLATITFARH